MELGVLMLIAVLVGYYGHSLKVAREADVRLKTTLLTDLHDFKKVLTQVTSNINEVEKRMTEIDSSIKVEWKHFNKQKIDPMLEKLDEIGALSVYLHGIEDTLECIENTVDAIAAHPAFTWSEDND